MLVMVALLLIVGFAGVIGSLCLPFVSRAAVFPLLFGHLLWCFPSTVLLA